MHCPINDHCTLVIVKHTIFILDLSVKTPLVDFSFSSQKVWNLDVSISSRIMRFVCKISLLETRENIFGFLFSSRNWRKCLKFLHFFAKVLVLFSNQKTDLDISLFSSRNSRCGFHISLSLLDLTFWHLVNAWLYTMAPFYIFIYRHWTLTFAMN